MDYLVFSSSLMKNVMKFKVLPPSFDSKHTPIIANFKSFFVKVRKGKVLNHPNIYKRDNDGAPLFQSYLTKKIFRRNEVGKLGFDFRLIFQH